MNQNLSHQLYEVFGRVFFQLFIFSEVESMPLIKPDGFRIFLQRPEVVYPAMLNHVFQQYRADGLSLQRRLNKELLHLGPLHPDKAFDNAVVIYPGVLQEPRVGQIFLRFGGNLQDIKIKLVAFKDRVKVQPVIEDFNFSQSSRVIRSCLP